MAMNELRKEVEAAAMAELNRANAKFPLFNSTHEGYAVILEAAGLITPGYRAELIRILYAKYETIRDLESEGV